MRDYQCSYNQYNNLSIYEKEVDFDMKSAFFQCEEMVRLTKHIQSERKCVFCRSGKFDCLD